MDTKLQEIIIRAKKDVFGGNLGDTLSTFKGDGLDFREIKEYEIGDDVKKINWKATAKTGRTQVNIFNVERELNIVIAFLISGTVHFGSVKLKQEVISEIIALLSYSSIKNKNKLSGIFFSDKEEKIFANCKNGSIIYNITESSFKFDCVQKNINYDNFCEYINNTVKNKSLIFIIGDFYGDIDFSSIAYKHDVYSLIVRDSFEEYPYISGDFDFVSPIDFSSSEVYMNKTIANNFKKLIKEQDAKLFEHFDKHQITYGKIYTNEDIYLRVSQIIKA